MKILSIREVRAALSRLHELVAREGEILITRHGRAVARILPTRPSGKMPSHRHLRDKMRRLDVGSEASLREDRDGR